MGAPPIKGYCKITGKQSFANDRVAKKFIKYFNSSPRENGSPDLGSSYFCDHCKSYHVTTNKFSLSSAIERNKEKVRTRKVEAKDMDSFLKKRIEYLERKNKPFNKK